MSFADDFIRAAIAEKRARAHIGFRRTPSKEELLLVHDLVRAFQSSTKEEMDDAMAMTGYPELRADVVERMKMPRLVR